MEAASYLTTGHARTANVRTRKRNGWTEIARVLNSGGDGCVKDWKRWAKYWRDKKAAVKRKASLADAARRKTGGGIDDDVVELSDIDQRILTIAGLSFAVGDRHLSINPFPESDNQPLPPPGSERNSNESENLLQALEESKVGIVCPQSPQVASPVIPPGDGVISPVQDGVESVSFTEEMNVCDIVLRTSVTVDRVGPSTASGDRGRIVETPTISTRSVLPSQSGFFPRQRNDAHVSPRRGIPTGGVSAAARRRRIRRPSPPSQRRSEMASLTERFIALEERHAEAQQTIARSLELYAQGHLKIAEAINKLTDALLQGHNT